MRRSFVAANWKMNGDRASSTALAESFKKNIDTSNVDVAVFAPAVYVAEVANVLKDSAISVGGQSSESAASGAFTGETSLAMLKDVGATHVLVGHSERRTMYGETDAIVAEKTAAALEAGVVPVLCIGETLEERESGVTEKVCATQLEAVIEKVGIAAFDGIIIAYEPVWAIGTGVTASSQQAQDVHAFIRELLAKLDANIAAKTLILYGGSMKAANAKELIGQPDIDGGLVGGASLMAEEFAAICAAGS